jgi:choloylglycine hydrolase
MNRFVNFASFVVAFCLTAIGVAWSANACTGIRTTATDGTVVQARTMEFGIAMDSNVIIVPRGYERTGTTPDGTPGRQWTAKYACVGANGVGMPVMLDGVNEKGLACGLFYFPGMAQYMPYKKDNAYKTLAAWELGSYILENFATVDEAREGLSKIRVPEVMLAQWGFSPGVHYVVMDATGKSFVVEFVDGQLRTYDNPLGVLTNCPTFDWHMTNLRNYVKLSPTIAPPMKLDGLTLSSFGQGSGMLGMPGDFTPPSRFVRAVAFSQSVEPVETGEDAVLQAFHILNNFDIPKGSVRDVTKDKYGNVVCEETQWTSACDLKAKRFYFRTIDNSQIRMVDLMQATPNAAEIVTLSMAGKEQIESLLPTSGKTLATATHE